MEQKWSKKLARGAIISSIWAIIAIVVWLIKWVWGMAVSAEQLKEVVERKEITQPIISNIQLDVSVIKNDTSWIKEHLRSNQ